VLRFDKNEMNKQFFRWWAHKLGIATHGCWIWQGEVSEKGYPIHDGKFLHRNMALSDPNRVGWFNGTRFRRQVNHQCMVKRCVNPLHLATVSRTAHRAWHEQHGWWKEPGKVSALVYPMNLDGVDGIEYNGVYVVTKESPVDNCSCRVCCKIRREERRNVKSENV